MPRTKQASKKNGRKTNSHTATAIGHETHSRLKEFCEENQLGMSEVTDAALIAFMDAWGECRGKPMDEDTLFNLGKRVVRNYLTYL